MSKIKISGGGPSTLGCALALLLGVAALVLPLLAVVVVR